MYSLTRGVLASASAASRRQGIASYASAAASAAPVSQRALYSAFAAGRHANGLSLVAALAAAPARTTTAAAAVAVAGPQQQQLPLSARRAFSTSASRWAANPQAGKPTSDNVSHMVKNIKEEAGQVASSLSSSIAGKAGSGADKRSGGGEVPTNASEILSDARSITAEMTKQMPQPALVWGAAGVIPYVTTAGASIYLARQAWLVGHGIDTHLDLDTAQALLLHAQNIQITYGAILLSFLGALHWGFEFSKYGGVVGNRRYVLGLVPLAIGWPSLLLTPSLALTTQWAGFVVAWFLDLQATNAGWVPKWYSTYRFWLTLFVGTSILATLAGTRYYSNDAAASGQRAPSAKLLESKRDAVDRGAKVQKRIEGDVEAAPAGEEGDSYVKVTNIRKHQEEEEERKRKEQEKKEKKDDKAAKQEEKLSKQMEKADSKDA
ncbi:hypothetical protein OC842_005442 [Tilletia horrida]|uniref:Mitochondrial inner membrane protein 1 n=1 Tax=Tilletia horrida TaxID=155126 RepID=A0AAN6JIF0_9BASI|nr:hypothetical protein OC842_005442 [Tilletia horrida]